VASVKYKDLEEAGNEECSRIIRERVNRVRKVQMDRYRSYRFFSNSQLQPSMISRFCRLDEKCKALLSSAFEKLGLSARAHNRILKVSRTIADMDGSEDIRPQHLAEAIQYRSLDRRFFGV